MTATQFESDLRGLLRARPFRPFVVQLDDGRSFQVTRPAAAIGGGGAGLVDAHGDIQLIECEQVQGMKPVEEELSR